MKFIFLYSSRGCRNHTNWDPEQTTIAPTAIQYKTDGYSYVGTRLVEKGIVDKVLAFVEIGKHFGTLQISENHTVHAIPHITCIEPYIESGDVIFVRGCWKHWAEILGKLCKDHWMIYYGAGTPRSGWRTWHVVLQDLLVKPTMGKKHPAVPFTKPINYNIFYPQNITKEYDILLNSCFHIYDKKGQYKLINAAIEYKKLFGKNLKIALPGGFYRNTHTSHIPEIIEKNKLDVYRPGTIPREKLNELIGKSALYVHIGYGEQNARSALEAMRCNLPIYIARPDLWPKFVGADPNIAKICSNPNDPILIAKDIHQMLVDIEVGKYKGASKYFDENNSPEKTVQEFTNLINIFKKYPKPDQNLLRKELGI